MSNNQHPHERSDDLPDHDSAESVELEEELSEAASNEPTPDITIVGIGASAGGLEALRSFIPSLPGSSNMAYVVAQHLSPQHRSMLVSLLMRNTSLAVSEIKDGERIEPNHIYITPPNSDVFIVNDNILHLRKPTSDIGPKPSIDYFFTSLSEVMGEHAIGIILSGTGTDGAHGARAIKAAGGIVIAQESSTAKYDGMPNAAVDTGCVDIVTAPESMGGELEKLVAMPHPRIIVSDEATPQGALDRIFRAVRKHTDVDFSEYKPTTIGRRIERRMNALDIPAIEEYVDHIEHTPAETDNLLKDILISVTSFFRDKDAFKALSDHIGRLLDESKTESDTIRVWVPGCATGEEAYSIAILILELLGRAANRYTIQVFGTDLDTDALALARKGIYPEASMAELDKHILGTYFTRYGTNYQVNKRVRELVVFARQDMITDPPFSHLDIISCRNLLIYFTSELQRRIFPLFHYALVDGGILFLGKSESVNSHPELFGTLDKKWKIYRKKRGYRPSLNGFTGTSRYRTRAEADESPAAQKAPAKPPLEDSLRAAILDTYGPASVVIDANYNILHIYGDVTDYLMLSPGQAELNLTKMARGDISIELRALAHKVQREGNPLTGSVVRVKEADGGSESVRISVRPMAGYEEDGLLMVSFEHVDLGVCVDTAPEDEERDPRIVALEQELFATREHLQTVVQELETANEELQSVNEELQSSNEELQSSNEELETSNEELQSTNEELITVNEELQVKTGELSVAYADIENIQKSVGHPIIVVDDNLVVTRYTSAAATLFDITPNDVGSLVTAIPTRMELPKLKSSIKNVIDGLGTAEAEIEHDGTCYLLRINPYRDDRDAIVGAVLVFIDVTYRIKMENELKGLNRDLEKRVSVELDKRRQQEQLLVLQSKLAAMGEMLGAIAHQWRQPLNGIGLVIQNIHLKYENGELTDEFMNEWTNRAMELVKYMSETITDFKNFFKPDKERVEFSPADVVRRAISFVESSINNRNITIETDMDDSLILTGLPNEYCQAVINLLSNARDVLIERNVERPVITVSLAKHDDACRLDIIDNGGGIGKDILPEIFNPYFTTKKSGGTGIGLYMTRLIVENNMNGTVTADNADDGARFSVIIRT